MKTTLDLPKDLLQSAKKAAKQRHTTLQEVVSQALSWELGLGPEKKPAGRRVTFPILDSVAPGSMKLTNEDLRRLDEEEDARQYQLVFGEERISPVKEESFESLVAAISRAVHKLKELGERNAFPEDEEMVVLLQNPCLGELWKRFAIQVQLAGEEDFELITDEDVQDFLEIAASLSPTDVEAGSELGNFLFMVIDENETACKVFSEARDRCLSQLVECTAGLAGCFLEMDQTEEACKILEETLSICPEADELVDMLEDVQDYDADL